MTYRFIRPEIIDNIPIRIQNFSNRILLAKYVNVLIVTNPVIHVVTVASIILSIPIFIKDEDSMKAIVITAGILSINEVFRAKLEVYPLNRSVDTVIPDLLIPGIIENPCAIPSISASNNIISFLLSIFPLDRYNRNPVMNSIIPIIIVMIEPDVIDKISFKNIYEGKNDIPVDIVEIKMNLRYLFILKTNRFFSKLTISFR